MPSVGLTALSGFVFCQEPAEVGFFVSSQLFDDVVEQEFKATCERTSAMAAKKKIQVTQVDYDRLTALIDSMRHIPAKDQVCLDKLQGELDRARVIASKRVKPDVVTMNSTVKLRDLDDGRLYEYQLVYPQDADPEENKLSVLAPVGTALLGYSIGDAVEWQVPAGIRHFQIEDIVYQPEASGEYEL